MKATGLLLQREVRSVLRTPLLYLVGAPLLVAFGWAFYSVFVGLRTAELRRYFEIVQYLLVVATPILGMRSFSEERRSGSADLLLVRPVSDFSLVVAKFGGVVVQQLVLLSPIAFFVLVVDHFGELDAGAVAVQVLGTCLGASLVAALAVAASAWTRSQMVAAAIALTVGFVQWFADVARSVTGFDLVSVVGARPHLETFRSGVLSVGDVAFFLGWTVAWLAVARLGVATWRWSP